MRSNDKPSFIVDTNAKSIIQDSTSQRIKEFTLYTG